MFSVEGLSNEAVITWTSDHLERMCKNVQECGHSLIKVLTWNLLGGTDENHKKKINQRNQQPSRNSNCTPPEYKSRVSSHSSIWFPYKSIFLSEAVHHLDSTTDICCWLATCHIFTRAPLATIFSHPAESSQLPWQHRASPQQGVPWCGLYGCTLGGSVFTSNMSVPPPNNIWTVL
jgi:hypothetical protein